MNAPTSLRFAANLKWLFNELPFLERFHAAAQAGFAAVEYASPYDHAPAVLRAALRDAGLQQVLINTPAGAPGSIGANGYACVPGAQETFRRGIDGALRYAGELACPLVHVMAGRVPQHVDDEQALDVLRDNLAWAAGAASGTGVKLVIEVINRIDAPRYVLRSHAHACALLDAIGASGIELLFDVYHCQMNGGDVIREFSRFRPRIAHVQFADSPGRHEPGTGALLWPELVKKIIASGYDGWIGCEYRPETTTLDGLGWIVRIGRS